MTRSEPMRTLPLAEFLRLYNDSAYHGWSGYDDNDYPPCDADDVQVCFAPDDLPHDRLGRWSSYSLRGKPVSPETAVRLIRILDESVRKELCFPDVDLLAPSPNSGYDHAHGWAHPDGYVGLDMGCGFWLRGRTIFCSARALPSRSSAAMTDSTDAMRRRTRCISSVENGMKTQTVRFITGRAVFHWNSVPLIRAAIQRNGGR